MQPSMRKRGNDRFSRIWARFCLIAFTLAASPTNPDYIPIWQGRDPVLYCIDPAIEPLRPEILYAFWTWAAQTGLRYAETKDCRAPRTIAYGLGSGMPPGTLGTGSFPAYQTPEEQAPDGRRPAGDVLLNDAIPWTAEPGLRDLALPLLLHETGHAFGMGESAHPEEVMYPVIQQGRIALTTRERATIRFLYLGEQLPR